MSLGHPAGVPAKMPFSVRFFLQEVPGTPAGRPLSVPPGVPGTSGRCPGDFLSLCALFFPEFYGDGGGSCTVNLLVHTDLQS